VTLISRQLSGERCLGLPSALNGVTLLAKFDGEFASRSNTYAGTGTILYRW
jgi:hypothetical protein